MQRYVATILAAAALAFVASTNRAAAFLPGPLQQLSHDVRKLAARLPAPSALEIMDLSTGYHLGLNAGASMPAASTIKIPVMVEVFAQLQAGRYDLNYRMGLRSGDKDYGSGELCDAPIGSTYSVSTLLEKMIDISDNTATNMLIRLVGRRNINLSMVGLGLERTRLADDIRTAGWDVRRQLRTSPADLVHLLALMAHRQLIDEWSSNEMISILEQDQYNTLLPEPLPDDIPIAHKTGSFFDTLNDAGIVYAADAPYVIAVMTTALPSQTLGRTFIRSISRLTYADEVRLARWRESSGLSFPLAPAGPNGSASPDVRYWSSGLGGDDSSGGGGGRGGRR
ncbi:MAG: serine hydrolase [Candidatus Eremiobacteraeota bacterium]|nr:serine hydrolase [Candidatus Eremiobacteraeota bacterium]MBV8373736.1 serine hydrolase [Candidatus Eremiobacteraeota bacterium]